MLSDGFADVGGRSRQRILDAERAVDLSQGEGDFPVLAQAPRVDLHDDVVCEKDESIVARSRHAA